MANFIKAPFTVAAALLVPTYTNTNGVRSKMYPSVENGERFFCSFRSFGGTEREVNGVLAIEDTATVETWYRPDITSGCRIVILANGKVYDIISEPENVDLRNQFLQFKVTRVKGGL